MKKTCNPMLAHFMPTGHIPRPDKPRCRCCGMSMGISRFDDLPHRSTENPNLCEPCMKQDFPTPEAGKLTPKDQSANEATHDGQPACAGGGGEIGYAGQRKEGCRSCGQHLSLRYDAATGHHFMPELCDECGTRELVRKQNVADQLLKHRQDLESLNGWLARLLSNYHPLVCAVQRTIVTLRLAEQHLEKFR